MKALKRVSKTRSRLLWVALSVIVAILAFLLALPVFFRWTHDFTVSQKPQPFPVSVYPAQKLIVENPAANALIPSKTSSFTAAVGEATNMLAAAAEAIISSPWYGMLAPTGTRFVTVDPGFRKEQVAAAFGKALGWSATTTTAFLASGGTPAGVNDGHFAPGVYTTSLGMAASTTRSLVDQQFYDDVLSRYPASTESIVPLSEALTIASMIERETSDTSEMRMISGIIWNRLFTGMNLQIDSTVQYAKGTAKNWWPAVRPKDIAALKSPYNTYKYEGLPPGPISNPGVAAVIAALNPVKTDCLFYFHDSSGGFHCSPTYADHVALLKQYYGRGK